MNQFFKAHKKEIFLFLLMLFLELAMIFVLSQKNGLNIFFKGDGYQYQNIVNNLINHHVFSLDGEAPFLSTNFRTPIYPFWLTFIYIIFKSFVPAIFIGAAVFAISAPLAYLIAREIFSEKIAFISAVIFALEPWALYQAGFLAAEQIFIPLFLFIIYLFCLYIKSGSVSYMYWASFCLGFTVLIRPVNIFFILGLIFFSIIFEVMKTSWKWALKVTMLAFLIFSLVLTPWLIRNKIVLNSWQFSSASNINLYFGHYAMLEKYLGKISYNEDMNEKARKLIGAKKDEEALMVENSNILGKTAMEEIKNNLKSYMAVSLKALPIFLLKNSYGSIFFDVKIPNSDIQSKIYANFINKNWKSLMMIIKESRISSKFLLTLVFFWPIIILAATFGIADGLKRNSRSLLLWFLIFWILYFTFLAALGRDISRYKLTINAPLFMLAVAGFYEIKNKITKHADNS
ncbi:MAG: glycosyltransferase family 39 protein [Patescibacteria group bacterium]